MGSKVGKDILPLVAIGATALITGPAGMGLWGTEATVATVPVGAAAEQAAATPWWQSAWTWVKDSKNIIGLGMSGLSAIGTMGVASQQAAFRENAIKLQEARDSLALAEKERDSQRRLQQVLARQNNFFAAAGVNASEGSAFRAAEGARDSAERELSLYGRQRILASQAHASRRRRVGGARAGAIAGSLLQFGQDAWEAM